MLQNCSKLPLIAATMPTMHSCNCAYLSVATEMSTDSGDELNLWHLHCHETTCRSKNTATSTTGKELRLRHLHGCLQSLNHARLS